MDKVLTKAELVRTLSQQMTGLSKREASAFVEAFLGAISSALQDGQDVKIMGLGNFQIREKKERPGRNPRTGIGATIPARRVVVFQPSQKLKSQLKVPNREALDSS